jgi:hypothetical protein
MIMMAALKLVQLAKEKGPANPVLYTSARPLDHRPFLPKPYTVRQLLRAVADLLPPLYEHSSG